MAASINGIWNQPTTTHALNSAHPGRSEATAGSGSDSGSTDSATISANDFLTLLVTEMENQDPTANTDPNEYVNQLVQVNSLEQLISINQTLTSDSTAAATGNAATSPATQPSVSASGAPNTAALPTYIAQHAPANSAVQQFTFGNLAIPETNPAAQRVAQALAGQVNRQ
jgi:flagellar basal-body rod modification protein FlgD